MTNFYMSCTGDVPKKPKSLALIILFMGHRLFLLLAIPLV